MQQSFSLVRHYALQCFRTLYNFPIRMKCVQNILFTRVEFPHMESQRLLLLAIQMHGMELQHCIAVFESMTMLMTIKNRPTNSDVPHTHFAQYALSHVSY